MQRGEIESRRGREPLAVERRGIGRQIFELRGSWSPSRSAPAPRRHSGCRCRPAELSTRPPLASTCARASNFIAPATPWSAGPVPRITSVLPFSTTTSAFCGVANVMLTLTRLPGAALAELHDDHLVHGRREGRADHGEREPDVETASRAVAVGRCELAQVVRCILEARERSGSRSPMVWYDICRSGRAITAASMSFCASAYWPANTSSRTLGSAARACRIHRIVRATGKEACLR